MECLIFSFHPFCSIGKDFARGAGADVLLETVLLAYYRREFTA